MKKNISPCIGAQVPVMQLTRSQEKNSSRFNNILFKIDIMCTGPRGEQNAKIKIVFVRTFDKSVAAYVFFERVHVKIGILVVKLVDMVNRQTRHETKYRQKCPKSTITGLFRSIGYVLLSIPLYCTKYNCYEQFPGQRSQRKMSVLW